MEKIKRYNIENFGLINEANLDIGKINIVGGHNATGKSTASKLIYCQLKASCSKRQDFAYEALKYKIYRALNKMHHDIRYSRKIRGSEINDILEEYEQSKDEFYSSDETEFDKYFDKEIEDIDEFIDIIQENGIALYGSMLKNLLKIEFSPNGFNSMDNESRFAAGVQNSNNSEISESFKVQHLLDVNDVIYMDNFSIFDMMGNMPSRFRYRGDVPYSDHVDNLKSMLLEGADESVELFDEKSNEKIIKVETKIKNVIKGTIEFNNGSFVYSSKDSEPCSMINTASGIKQIGVIQKLLSNRKLKEGSFLIIDEPEVNLHPEWQFKLAEILTILVKDLNISIYINTHSPMFIESMEVFTKFYDLENDTNFYLTRKLENEEKYDFIKIGYDNLYELYNNLAKPFESIEVYRLKNEYKKGR